MYGCIKYNCFVDDFILILQPRHRTPRNLSRKRPVCPLCSSPKANMKRHLAQVHNTECDPELANLRSIAHRLEERRQVQQPVRAPNGQTMWERRISRAAGRRSPLPISPSQAGHDAYRARRQEDGMQAGDMADKCTFNTPPRASGIRCQRTKKYYRD